MIKYFKHWNIKTDTGEEEMGKSSNLPDSYAEVLYDANGFIYRALIHNSNDPEKACTFDYFCDVEGKIIERRTLNTKGEITIIARYEYRSGTKTAISTWPTGSKDEPERIPIPFER